MKLEDMCELENLIKDDSFNWSCLAELSYDEATYIVRAYYLPYDDFIAAIDGYDSKPAFFRDDELRFVYDLSLKYNTSENVIIRRIKEVRSIRKYIDKRNAKSLKMKKENRK